MKIKNFPSRSLIAASLGLLLCSQAVQAQDYDSRVNIYGGLSRYTFDKGWAQEDDTGSFFGGELPVNERWSVLFEHWDLESDYELAPMEGDINYNRFGVNYYFAPKGNWKPYLSLGMGEHRYDIGLPGKNEDNLGVDFGLGTKYFFNDNFFARSDVKLVRVTDYGDLDLALNIGFGWAFGKKASSSAPAVTTRPATPSVPATPARQVEADSDKDGVMDSRDRCANTPTDLAVDANGCPIMETDMMSQELMVNFDFDKSNVKPQYNSEIRDFADFMKTYSNTTVVIEGHTDSDGAEAYNKGLSERRANAVMNVLINQHSIPASRVSATGFGEARPLVPNTTADNKARNRRIMAEVTAEVQKQKKR